MAFQSSKIEKLSAALRLRCGSVAEERDDSSHSSVWLLGVGMFPAAVSCHKSLCFRLLESIAFGASSLQRFYALIYHLIISIP